MSKNQEIPKFRLGKYQRSINNKNTILDRNPNLKKEWILKLNIYSVAEVSASTNDKFYWKCKNNHVYLARVNNKVNGSGCPICHKDKRGEITNKWQLNKRENLLQAFPHIANEWDYKKNQLKPSEVLPNSNKKYWWICKNNHSYEASPNMRTPSGEKNGSGCPKCYKINRSEIVRSYYLKNNLTLLKGDPFLAQQFDVQKNGRNADQINCQSGLNAWWICPNGHSFKARVSKRYLRGDGCTKCSKTGISRIQIIILHELSTIFKKIESEKKIEKYKIDYYIPDLKLAIEYDGKRYHNLKNDLKKNESILKYIPNLIRLREYPLSITNE